VAAPNAVMPCHTRDSTFEEPTAALAVPLALAVAADAEVEIPAVVKLALGVLSGAEESVDGTDNVEEFAVEETARLVVIEDPFAR
jgi:hypothetical protein